MDKPWKVISAFVGVFIAGAVFGGFFSLGVGARWLAQETPASVKSTPAATATPAATTAPVVGTKTAVRPGAGAGGAQGRPSLLQVPQSWQAPQLLRRYAERLDLTPEQKQRIHPLVQRATEDYNRLRQNTWRETAIILQRLQQDISEVLTPEQREKLHKFEARQKELINAEQKQREMREQQKKVGAPQRSGANRPAPNGGERPISAPAASAAPATSGPATTSSSASTSDATVPTPSTEKKE